MTRQQKIDVAVEHLEELLSKQGIYLDYYSCWHRTHGTKYGDTLRRTWLDWIDKRSPYNWISCAFQWDLWNIPYAVWRDTNYKWTQWLKDNLKN